MLLEEIKLSQKNNNKIQLYGEVICWNLEPSLDGI